MKIFQFLHTNGSAVSKATPEVQAKKIDTWEAAVERAC